MDMQDIRQIAEKLVIYYERLTLEDAEMWAFALSTATLWLDLLNQSAPDLGKVNELMQRLDSTSLGTAWNEMYIFARVWHSRLQIN